jgi:hypothetical protein
MAPICELHASIGGPAAMHGRLMSIIKLIRREPLKVKLAILIQKTPISVLLLAC